MANGSNVMWRWRPFWIFYNKKFSQPLSHLTFFSVIDHTFTHQNQFKLASYDFFHRWTLGWDTKHQGGGPRVVVSTAAFHARVRGSVLGLGGLKETKIVSSPSTCESQYCGEPPWPRGSVLGLRPPGLEFRILCLEDSVISFISSSSWGSPGPV